MRQTARCATLDGAVVTVMIVDDQPTFRSAARRLVEHVDGFEVVAELASGEEAVVQCGHVEPSFVLMDVYLPGIDGIDATKQIVVSRPSTAVVLMSTYDSSSLDDDAARCGAVCYVRKEDLTPALLREVWSRHRRRGGGPE